MLKPSDPSHHMELQQHDSQPKLEQMGSSEKEKKVTWDIEDILIKTSRVILKLACSRTFWQSNARSLGDISNPAILTSKKMSNFNSISTTQSSSFEKGKNRINKKGEERK